MHKKSAVIFNRHILEFFACSIYNVSIVIGRIGVGKLKEKHRRCVYATEKTGFG